MAASLGFFLLELEDPSLGTPIFNLIGVSYTTGGASLYYWSESCVIFIPTGDSLGDTSVCKISSNFCVTTGLSSISSTDCRDSITKLATFNFMGPYIWFSCFKLIEPLFVRPEEFIFLIILVPGFSKFSSVTQCSWISCSSPHLQKSEEDSDIFYPLRISSFSEHSLQPLILWEWSDSLSAGKSSSPFG